MSKIYKGDLTVTIENAEDVKDITKVTGSVYISAEASLPLLESVGGSVYISAEASLPLLESVGEIMRVIGGKKLDAPKFKGEIFVEVESDDQYQLCKSQKGLFVAGCRGPWTKDECLKHWLNSRPDNQGRAALFVAAIEKA